MEEEGRQTLEEEGLRMEVEEHRMQEVEEHRMQGVEEHRMQEEEVRRMQEEEVRQKKVGVRMKEVVAVPWMEEERKREEEVVNMKIDQEVGQKKEEEEHRQVGNRRCCWVWSNLEWSNWEEHMEMRQQKSRHQHRDQKRTGRKRLKHQCWRELQN